MMDSPALSKDDINALKFFPTFISIQEEGIEMVVRYDIHLPLECNLSKARKILTDTKGYLIDDVTLSYGIGDIQSREGEVKVGEGPGVARVGLGIASLNVVSIEVDFRLPTHLSVAQVRDRVTALVSGEFDDEIILVYKAVRGDNIAGEDVGGENELGCQDEGTDGNLNGGVDEGADGNLNGGVDEGADGNVNGGVGGDVNDGVGGDVNEGVVDEVAGVIVNEEAGGIVNGGAGGIVNEEAVDEGADENVDEGVGGDVNEGVVDEVADVIVNEEARGIVNEGAVGIVNEGAEGHANADGGADHNPRRSGRMSAPNRRLHDYYLYITKEDEDAIFH